MNIGMIGAGSWGIALTTLLASNGHNVTVWSIDNDEIIGLKKYREHKDKLPGVMIDDSVIFTNDLEQAVSSAELLVFVVPSPFIRSTAKLVAPFVKGDIKIVNVSKGIEADTLMTLTDVIEEEIKTAQVGVLSGPSHAEEVGKKMPTTVVAGAKDKKFAELIQETFMNSYFRVYSSSDVIGIEIGAALKNVIALAAGMADGLMCGDNAKAALITRGMFEISNLGIAMGGYLETFSGLSGIGDLIVTCESVHSRNRRAGYLMGQGMTYKEAMTEVKMVVEGVYSAKAALKLAEKYNVEMPIVEIVNRVLFNDLKAEDAMTALLNRVKTRESSAIDWN